jgi:cytochrome c oxidase subunit 4
MTNKSSTKAYLYVWLGLMLLLAATWGFSILPFHAYSLVVSMGISIAKTALIILFFMHMKYSPKILWLFAGAGFVWLIILLELTLSDYVTRGGSWSQ